MWVYLTVSLYLKKHAFHIIMVLFHIRHVLKEEPGPPVITGSQKKNVIKGVSELKGSTKDILIRRDLKLGGT